MNSVSALNRCKPGEFAEFINDLLGRLYATDAAVRAEAFGSVVDFGIWTPNSPVDVFERLFNSLNAQGKATFKLALGIAFCETRPDIVPDTALCDLIYLIGFSEAYQALDSISCMIADGTSWHAIDSTVYFEALAVLKGMGKSPQAYSATRRLVTARHFPEYFAFDAYEALVLGKPSAWADDLLWLRPRLSALRNLKQISDVAVDQDWYLSRVQSLATDVIAQCSLATISAGMDAIETEPSCLDVRDVVGDILIALLGDAGALKLTIADNGQTVLAVGKSSVCELWPTSLDQIDTFLFSNGIYATGADDIAVDVMSREIQAALPTSGLLNTIVLALSATRSLGINGKWATSLKPIDRLNRWLHSQSEEPLLHGGKVAIASSTRLPV